jgi:hypothetical protein
MQALASAVTHFQVKRSVPKKYSKVFEITFVAIRMESYRIFSFTVQVIIMLLSKSNDNFSDDIMMKDFHP